MKLFFALILSLCGSAWASKTECHIFLPIDDNLVPIHAAYIQNVKVYTFDVGFPKLEIEADDGVRNLIIDVAMPNLDQAQIAKFEVERLMDACSVLK